MTDTICALATAPSGALGIIRISGPQSLEILSHIFTRNLTQAQPNTIHYGHIKDGSEIIDEVLVSIFRAPHSYTGEDSAEISCHGSRYILNKVLELLIQNGCRMAQPGEYTQRAFLNGKMDLSQAEAVADLIASGNKATHQIAMSQLRGNFSSELSHLREQLLKLTSLLELELDFSDHEDLEFADRSELTNIAKTINKRITYLAHSFETGQALKNGIPVAIVGKTNVGKSTLLNKLLRDDRAIVSSVHGTTRDTVEDIIDIQGVTFRFIDTAGIRQTTDEVEQIGISRTYAAIDKARIVLWLIDAEPTAEEIKDMLERSKGKSLIIIQNKIDIQSPVDSSIFSLVSQLVPSNNPQPSTDNPQPSKGLSPFSLNLLMINTVVPMLFAYGRYKGDERLCDRAFDYLEQLKAENNYIMRNWSDCGILVKNAADSQALIQLKKQYCDRKDCLRCRIGYEFLKKEYGAKE
jgi:tRNA modification GTPase